MIHELKTEPEYFAAVVCGNKTFEIRKNDRCFHAGDFLALNEFDPEAKAYTGRCCLVEVTFRMLEKRFVKEGYVVMGIRPLTITKAINPDLLKVRINTSVPVYGEE